MNIYLLVFVLFGANFAIGLHYHGYSNAFRTSQNPARTNDRHNYMIDENTAMSLVKAEFLKTHGSLEDYNFIICGYDEVRLQWSMVFEAKDSSVRGIDIEYLVDKIRGAIHIRREIPRIPKSINKDTTTSQQAILLSKSEILAIARKEATLADYPIDLTNYIETVCELSDVWLVNFEYKRMGNTHGRYYVINKHDGKVLVKQ